jgi:hypothetical protein
LRKKKDGARCFGFDNVEPILSDLPSPETAIIDFEKNPTRSITLHVFYIDSHGCHLTKEKGICTRVHHNSLMPLIRLANEIVRGFDALRPLSPAAIIDPPVIQRKSSFCEGGIDNSSGHTGAATADDGDRWLDAFGRKDLFEFRGGEERLVVRIEEVCDGHGDGVGDMSGRKACVN